MSMIEQLGEQLMEPMRAAMGDALAVAEEQARRYRFALDALNGNYPGSGLRNGQANGHATAMGGPVAALNQAPAEPEPEPERDEDWVDPGRHSVKEIVEAVLRSAGRTGFMGVTDVPGAMKAFEVMEVMDRWGWRDRSKNRLQTVMSTLSNLAKDGLAVRVDRGSYAHARVSGDGSVILDETGQRVDPNDVSIKVLVRHVVRMAGGEALRPSQVVGRMEAAGWRNRNEHRANTVRALLGRMMRDEGVIVRPAEGVYAWNVGANGQAPVAAEPESEPVPSPPQAPVKPDGPTGAEMVTAALQHSPGRPLAARQVMEYMLAQGWSSTSERPLSVVQACLAALARKDPHISRPELGLYLYKP